MASASDFGARLRQARERKGVALREIALKTKISVSALEALERNDISRLPGGIFSRAFVRSYAVEVGLDPERTVQDFIEQFPHESVTAGTPLSSQADDNEAIESDRQVAHTLLKLVLISVPIAGALIYFGLNGRRSPNGSGEPPASVAAGVPVPTEPAAAQPSAPPAAPAASSSTTSARATPGAATAPPVTSAPVAPGAAATAPLVVTVRTKADCWVTASVDGVRQSSRTVRAGEDLRLSAFREIVLTTGDAGAVDVTINGSPARPLGAAGEVVTKRITLQNYKSLLQ